MRLFTIVLTCFLLTTLSTNLYGWNLKQTEFYHLDNIRWQQNWTELNSKSEVRALDVLKQILAKSKTGKSLLFAAKRKASGKGEVFSDLFKVGEVSLTDTTLIRKFSAHNPHDVQFETKSVVHINRNLSVKDAVLDMAHELVHYIHRPPFNPYQTEFTLDSFIHSTVEGKGGEVEAYLAECSVQRELFSTERSTASKCTKVIDEKGRVSKHKGVKEFYKTGLFLAELKSGLQEHGLDTKALPHLNAERATFISSAYGVPYPLAAYREFVAIMGRACENDRKRLSYFLAADSGRSPAASREPAQITRVRRDFFRRCRHF